MISRLAPERTFNFLFSAAIIKKFFPSLSFLLVGDGPLMKECVESVRKKLTFPRNENSSVGERIT